MNEHRILTKATPSTTDLWLRRAETFFTLFGIVIVVGFCVLLGATVLAPMFFDGY